MFRWAPGLGDPFHRKEAFRWPRPPFRKTCGIRKHPSGHIFTSYILFISSCHALYAYHTSFQLAFKCHKLRRFNPKNLFFHGWVPSSSPCLHPNVFDPKIRWLWQVEAHADGAFNASRFEVFLRLGFPVGLVFLSFPRPLPARGSFTLDTNLFLSLVSSSSSPRERQRLNRLNQPHAGSWVTALPASIDGPSDCLPDRGSSWRAGFFCRWS